MRLKNRYFANSSVTDKRSTKRIHSRIEILKKRFQRESKPIASTARNDQLKIQNEYQTKCLDYGGGDALEGHGDRLVLEPFFEVEQDETPESGQILPVDSVQ